MTQTSDNLPLLYRPNLAGQRYVWQLAAAYSRGLWIYDPDYATISDTEAWEKIRRDAVFAAAIHKWQTDVAGLDWVLEPASEEPADVYVAEILTDLIDQIVQFPQARRLASEARFRGDSWMFIHGHRGTMRVGPDPEEDDWWYPAKLQHVDRRRFRIRNNHERGEPVDTDWEFFSLAEGEWKTLDHPEWFMRTVFDDQESSLGYGRGLLQAIYFFWRAKSIALAQGLQGLERWANGLVTAGIDGARIGSHTITNDTIVDDWLALLEKTRTEHFIAHDKRDELKIHWPSASGHELVKFWVEYFDRSIRELILAANIAGPEESGGFGEGKKESEQEEKQSTIAADQASLSEDFDRSVVVLCWNLNRQQIMRALQRAGLSSARRPKFKIARQSADDPMAEVDRIARILEFAELPKTWVHDRIDAPMAQGDEETYGGQQEMPFGDGAGEFLQGGSIPEEDDDGDDDPFGGGGGMPPGFQGKDTKKTGTWVTIGAQPGEDGKNHGGTPVFIEDGKITKGPEHMEGKTPDEVSAESKVEQETKDKASSDDELAAQKSKNLKERLAEVENVLANEKGLSDDDRQQLETEAEHIKAKIAGVEKVSGESKSSPEKGSETPEADMNQDTAATSKLEVGGKARQLSTDEAKAAKKTQRKIDQIRTIAESLSGLGGVRNEIAKAKGKKKKALLQIARSVSLFTGSNVEAVRDPGKFDTSKSIMTRSLGGEDWKPTREDYKNAQQDILNAARAKLPKHRHQRVFRGLVLPKKLANQLIAGEEISLGDFSSFSTRESVANQFSAASPGGPNQAIVFEMTAEYGTHLGDFSKYQEEEEMVVGGQAKIQSVREKGGRLIVTLKHLGPVDSSSKLAATPSLQDAIRAALAELHGPRDDDDAWQEDLDD